MNPTLPNSHQPTPRTKLRTCQSSAANRSPSPTEDPTLDSIQHQLESITALNASRTDTLQRLVDVACRSTNAIWAGHLSITDQQPIQYVAEHSGVENQNLGLMKSSLLPTAEAAIKSVAPQIVTSGELTVIATPVYDPRNPSQASECLCLALSMGSESSASFLLILQMIAAYVSRWHERERTQSLTWQIDATAAIAELTAEVSSVKHQARPEIVAANRLAGFLSAEIIAIGYVVREGSLRVKVASMSGAMEVSSTGALPKQIKAAMEESLVRGDTTSFPSVDDSRRSMKLAHREMIDNNPSSALVTSPLTTHDGRTIGAWLCLLPAGGPHQDRTAQFARTASTYLADSLDVARRAAASPARRLVTWSRNFIKGRAAKVTAAVAATITLAMLIPIPHRIDCSCVLKPAKRQFAVAPHNGVLEQSYAKPGDIVAAGQVIARMDDREVQLEMVDVLAQQQSATKQRDVSRTARDAAETKIAELKLRQLDAKLQLIRHRLKNLEIKSQSSGVVLQGDLQDVTGAPVRTGDVLMEIAALDNLKLEIEIPASEISYIQPNQTASIVLEGNPFETLHGALQFVHPESEVRDQRNVFLGEVWIDNSNQKLRPGMKGRVKVTEHLRPIGWILFHRPCEKMYSLFQ